MILVGLTGGIGSGKSTVARLLEERGAVVVDADELARKAVEPGGPGHDRVVERFGDAVVGADGAIDRAALADLIFDDPEARRDLEAIVHPEVFRLLQDVVRRHQGEDAVVVFDAALLVETGFDHACDVVVVVSAPDDLQVRRLVERGMDEQEARRRIAAQIEPEARDARADILIPNAGSLDELERRVDRVWATLKERASGG